MHTSTRMFVALLFTSSPLMAAENLHIEQSEINQLIESGQLQEAFDLTFEIGDELFEHDFTASEGGGANVGNGQRFTLVPRADLTGAEAWASHFPTRSTGPNSQSCNACHNLPFGDGAGDVSQNNIRDPLHTGNISQFINRQPPHLFGIGALQLLAEEMTTDLQNQRDQALAMAQNIGGNVAIGCSPKGFLLGAWLLSQTGQSLPRRWTASTKT